MLSPVIIDVIYRQEKRFSLSTASAPAAIYLQNLQLESTPASQVGGICMFPEAFYAFVVVVLESMGLLPFIEEAPWFVNSALGALPAIFIDQCSWFA